MGKIHLDVENLDDGTAKVNGEIVELDTSLGCILLGHDYDMTRNPPVCKRCGHVMGT